MFIDIHNHSLYGVDDGAENIEETVLMLKQAKSMGAEAVIMTPHYRHGMFGYPTDTIRDHFSRATEAAKELGLQLYLGCEYHVNSDIYEYLESKRCLTLAGSDYVLTEYSYETPFSRIKEYTQKLLATGYRPVIAHAERYACIFEDVTRCMELRQMGALIQMNADSILGLDGRKVAGFCKKALKKNCIDIVASDAHGIKNRVSHMGECYDRILKKFGEEYANRLFYENPMKIIRNM